MRRKEYVRSVPHTWFLQRPSWTRFIVREATAVFVGAYAIFLLVLVYRAQEAPSFSVFLEGLRSPVSLLLHLIALMMVLYHTFTWFNLTPQALPLWQGEERVPPRLIVAASYVAWLIVSGVVAWIVIAQGG